MAELTESQQARLARRLGDLRAGRRGLTQEALARAFSVERPVTGPTVSSWESDKSPKSPTVPRLDAYARFFASSRTADPNLHRPLTLAELAENPEDRERYSQLRNELFDLVNSENVFPHGDDETPQRTLLQFDEGHIVIVCPEAPAELQGALADEKSMHYSSLHRYADTDALIEVFGHVRALNPDRKVFYKTPRAFVRADLQNHLILIGGTGWSRTTEQIFNKLRKHFPVVQFSHPSIETGDVFKTETPDGEELELFLPTIENGEVTEDVALIARVRNPFNSSRTLTFLNATHSRGVVGAALAVTDETIRSSNQEYLAERFPSGDFALLVRVNILNGEPLAPDFNDKNARRFEWSPGDANG
jgi:transcriptional regulator with XRE-family HTH domain